MRKILITRGTVCGGRPVEAGSVVEASDEDAAYLIRAGKAEPALEEQPSLTDAIGSSGADEGDEPDFSHLGEGEAESAPEGKRKK